MKLLFAILFCVSLQAQTTYKLGNIGLIIIPKEMELQNGIYKQKVQNYVKQYQFEVNENRIVFQQKGLNSTNKNSMQSYARIVIETQYGDFGYDTNISSQEYEEVNAIFKYNVTKSISQIPNMKLLQWYGVSNVKINGVSAIKISYTRQLGTNPSVYVESYMVPKGNKQYIFTFSYRVNDRKTWQSIYSKILASLRIK